MPNPTATTLVTEAYKRSGVDSPTSAQSTRAKDEHLESVLELLFADQRFKLLEAEFEFTLSANATTFTLPTDFGLIDEETRYALWLKYTTSPVQWTPVGWVERELYEDLMQVPDQTASYPYFWTIDRATGYTGPLSTTAWPMRLRYFIDIRKTTDASHAALRNSLYQQRREAIIQGLVVFIWKDLDDDRWEQGMVEFLGDQRTTKIAEQKRHRPTVRAIRTAILEGPLT